MKVVPDTSVIIDGRITAKIESGEFAGAEIIIPEAVVAELEAQANQGRETGFSGLNELKKLSEMVKEGKITLRFAGDRPTLEQIRLASRGAIDAVIRHIASEAGATFITSDIVQAEVARAKGLEVIYLSPVKEPLDKLRLEEFFTKDTISVHLKERAIPMAKRGAIGNLRLVELRDRPMSEKEMRELAHEIIERAKRDPHGFIEIEKEGATIIQLGPMRIAIARPPFSDGLEITAVRPIANISLDDYRMSRELKERILEKQRGILIAGPPGAGKSTLAAGIAQYLQEHEFVVKTMEKPRDLQVSEEITQYTALENSMANTADILLLVRPDYTIFDELRKTEDFKVFADLRLAGVGMVGVVHATRAIDALQRLIGRVELGIIPQIVDTIVFVEAGEIKKVYDIKFTVKVPSGMVEADLARPVIEVIDFETRELEFEVYSFGEQVVVMQVGRERVKKPTWRLVERGIQKEVGRYTEGYVEVEMKSDSKAVVYLEEEDIPRVLGKGGKTIEKIEKALGISIDVRSIEEKKKEKMKGEKLPVKVEITDKHIILKVKGSPGDTVEIYAGGSYLFTATIGRAGEIKITKGSTISDEIQDIIEAGEEIYSKFVG
ncbi:MAG: PINc/VapC family ATPase [Methanocellales archaeon]